MSDLMQKIAEVAPRHHAFLVKTANEVKESPFRDEILEEMNRLVKTALDWNSIKGGLRTGAGMAGKASLAVGGAAGAAAIGGIAMALAGDMYEAAHRGITKGRNYKAMMEANPQLNRMNSKEVQKAFSVLHRYNPEFSGDPTVSGAWVKSRVELGGPEIYSDVSQLKGLIDSRKNIADTKKLSPFKLERERKMPPGLSKSDFHEGMNDINSRLTNFEQNIGNQVFTNTFKQP